MTQKLTKKIKNKSMCHTKHIYIFFFIVTNYFFFFRYNAEISTINMDEKYVYAKIKLDKFIKQNHVFKLNCLI